MALIVCNECSSSISDRAPACPTCGSPTPGGTSRLVFSRPSFVGAAVSLEVYVDGMPYGRLSPRKSLEIPVAPGSHHVEVINSHGRSGIATIDTAPGATSVKVGAWGLRPSINVE
jgi:hypothetical protein